MKRRLEYLSARVLVLALAAAGLVLFCAAAYLGAAIRENLPLWPGIVTLAGAVGLMMLSFFCVFLPYHRSERLIRLFLEGYTISGLDSAQRNPMTPSAQQLLRRMEEDMNSSKLMKMNKRQAQYLALQNQINPHFLYNTLESIRSEALISGLDTVADMTEALAVFFRYTISKVENLVSVEEELQNCETYFRIQQYRFGSRLALEITCDPEDREEIFRCRLPKLTMQPILENAIIHGTEFKIGVGHLRIHLERTARRLLIRVSDDGVGMNEESLARLNDKLGKSKLAYTAKNQQSSGGVALVNVANRIQLLFGEEYGLHVYSVEGVGTDVEIALPAITSDREVTNQEALK